MIFVDTGVWYSALVAGADRHALCDSLVDRYSFRLITTDYVIDELLTLLDARGHRHVAIAVGDRFWQQTTATVERVTEADLSVAWQIFKEFTDKRWSFTDCTSYAVMQRLGVTEALSLDDHFHQFGLCDVRP